MAAAPRWGLRVEHRNGCVVFGHLVLILLIQPEILLGMETVTPLDVNFLSEKLSASLQYGHIIS